MEECWSVSELQYKSESVEKALIILFTEFKDPLQKKKNTDKAMDPRKGFAKASRPIRCSSGEDGDRLQ